MEISSPYRARRSYPSRIFDVQLKMKIMQLIKKIVQLIMKIMQMITKIVQLITKIMQMITKIVQLIRANCMSDFGTKCN